MNNLKFYNESIEEMQNRFDFLAESMEKLLSDLTDPGKYGESVVTLFREFHSLKALAGYLQLKPMYRTLHTIEDILSVLRHKKPPISKELLDWMYLAADHIMGWQPQIEKGDLDVEPLDAYMLRIIKTTSTGNTTGSDALLKNSVLIVTDEPTVQKMIKKSLTKRCKKLLFSQEIKEAFNLVKEAAIDQIFCDSVMKGTEVMKLILKVKKEYPEIPIIIHKRSVLSDKKREFFQKLGINEFMDREFTPDELIQKMEIVAKSYNRDKGIKLLTCPLLKESVEALKPLPETIRKIQEFRLDPEKGIRDLTAVILKDAALSTKIIKLVNSPSFGLRGTVNSIQQAISLIGKEKTIALSLQTFANDSFESDLRAYDITIDDFHAVAAKRMSLAVAWYSKVSLYETSLLSTAALISNIGQLLIAQELKDRGIEGAFLEIVQKVSPEVAEIDILNTSTMDMTADILSQWGLDETLINTVRFSNDLVSAPDSVKHLSIPLYVINTTVPISNTKCDPAVVDEMCDLLEEMNFDSRYYKEAVRKIAGR